MRTYVLERSLVIARPRDEVFPFFADAHNLQRLTPPFLRFRILTPGTIEMKPGARIDYEIRLRGIPIRWRTVIDAWEPPHRFVDRQVRGPYRKWIHEHRFEEVAGGTRCSDRIEYAVPGGPLIERLVNRLVVGPDVARIFDFRAQEMERAFDRT